MNGVVPECSKNFSSVGQTDLPETYMTAQFDKLALIFVALSNLTGGRKLWSTCVTKYVSSNDLQKVQPT